jgi:hypothetical protein
VAAVCGVVALLVLPVVIGALSRRWQTAVAVPSLPIWLLVLVGAGFALATNSGTLTQNGSYDFLYPTGVALDVAGSLLSALFLAAALGGLGWLARRAFAR